MQAYAAFPPETVDMSPSIVSYEVQPAYDQDHYNNNNDEDYDDYINSVRWTLPLQSPLPPLLFSSSPLLPRSLLSLPVPRSPLSPQSTRSTQLTRSPLSPRSPKSPLRYSDSALTEIVLLLDCHLPEQALPEKAPPLLTLVEMEDPHSPCADADESGGHFQPPDPNEAHEYAHKPLPPLPPSSYFRKRQSLVLPSASASSFDVALHAVSSPADERAKAPAPSPPSPTYTLSPRPHSMVHMTPTSTTATPTSPNRHASFCDSPRKIKQITGLQLNMVVRRPIRPPRNAHQASTTPLVETAWAAFGSSASLRMRYVDHREQRDEVDSPIPPLLETDREGSSKSHDSWGPEPEPLSPDAMHPSPWASDDAGTPDGPLNPEPAVRAASSESDAKVRDLLALHSQDLEVAWSYHTIASELAAPKRPATSHGATAETSRQASPQKPTRFIKFLHSDPSRKLRTALPSLNTSHVLRPGSRQGEKPRPQTSHSASLSNSTTVTMMSMTTASTATTATLDTHVASMGPQTQMPLQSAWDESDSEDDEYDRRGPSSGLVKDWLARKSGDVDSFGLSPTAWRTSELSKPNLVAKTGGHMRGLLSGAKEKAKGRSKSRDI